MEYNSATHLEALAKVCKDVGGFISDQAQKVSADQIEIKALNSLVSYVDQEAEKQLVAALASICPEAGFLTEEETTTQETKDWMWIIDPLDGTTNFLFNIPVYAVSVALYHKEEPVLACVYEIGRSELFTARKGGGAYCNGQKISVSKQSELAKSLLATGFPYYDFERLEEFNQLLAYFYTHSRGVRRLGSAAVDLAYVAAGRFNGFFEYGLHAWDVAAGILLVQEAGGTISDFKGGNQALKGKEIVASSQALYSDFQALVAQYMLP
jgi:myo-inositol-1(or 4)-monophosphatase